MLALAVARAQTGSVVINMKLFMPILLLSCSSVFSEPLNAAMRRRSNAGVYASHYARGYLPVTYVAIPLHSPIPVLHFLTDSPTRPKRGFQIPKEYSNRIYPTTGTLPNNQADVTYPTSEPYPTNRPYSTKRPYRTNDSSRPNESYRSNESYRPNESYQANEPYRPNESYQALNEPYRAIEAYATNDLYQTNGLYPPNELYPYPPTGPYAPYAPHIYASSAPHAWYSKPSFDESTPVILYAKPNPNGGFNYRRRPAKKNLPKKVEPIVIRVHKYRVSDDR